jgi:SMP-30/Gluconolactonase/LRE-like region
LYIADSGKKIWMRYRVQPDGSVTDGVLFLDASHDSGPGGPDGIRVDKKGNLYGAGPGGVWIISPEGKHIGTIKVPETVSNVAWGDKDGKTLYNVFQALANQCVLVGVEFDIVGDRLVDEIAARTVFRGARTPIRNLHLTGQDVTSLGVVGVLYRGVISASVALGRNLMGAVSKPVSPKSKWIVRAA